MQEKTPEEKARTDGSVWSALLCVLGCSNQLRKQRGAKYSRSLEIAPQITVCCPLPFTEVELIHVCFQRIREEAKVGIDIEDLLDEENVDEIPFDLIMDADSDEDSCICFNRYPPIQFIYLFVP